MRKIGNKDFQLSPQDTQFQEDNKFNIANVFWVAIALFLKKRRLNVRGTPGSVLTWLTWLKILVIVVIVFFWAISEVFWQYHRLVIFCILQHGCKFSSWLMVNGLI